MLSFRLIFVFLIFSLSTSLKAQSYFELLDNDSNETKEERLDFMLDFMKEISFESAADIGSGNMEFILEIANKFSDKNFFLEDIDSSQCNRMNMRKKIQILDLTEIDTNRIFMRYGNIKSTMLPDHQFDLVIMSGLIHEIDFVDEFFSDVKRILKPGGSIIISDAFYKNPPGLHHGCKNRFLTMNEIDRIMIELKLNVMKDWRRIGIQARNYGTYISRFIQCSFN